MEIGQINTNKHLNSIGLVWFGLRNFEGNLVIKKQFQLNFTPSQQQGQHIYPKFAQNTFRKLLPNFRL